MKVYLSGSIRGGRQFQKVYEIILNFLRSENHEVLTYHVADKNILEIETNQSDRDIFLQDTSWLEECDCVIAEVSVPSLGVGYEISYVLDREKPVLALYDQKKAPISAMITGNTSPFIFVFSYDSIDSLLQKLSDFLEKVPS